MTQETVTDALLREFLLGKLDDEEQARIEDLFLTDPQAREKVLAAEQDLIEDYFDDSLTTADREIFLSRYAQTPAQRRKLRITKSIKGWAVRQAAVTQPVSSTTSIWSRARVWLRQRPAFVIPIAVATIIAIIIGAVWLNSRMERNRHHLTIEQELARLNSPESLREFPPLMLELRPVSVRSVERQAEFTKAADIQVVELRLSWIQKEHYSTYQAEVRRAGDGESFTIGNLQAENDGGYAIRIRLPANILTRGQYQIELTGIAPDGGTGLVEEYTFTVSG